jgi:O-methyltransferase involved in polyketide biosynthesis
MDYSTGAHGGGEQTVQTPHSFTARMCAASRWIESQRTDSLFVEPQAYALAGAEGRAQPMGEWIMVPRTRFGDDARAYRMAGLHDLEVFEVDQQTTFDVKEPLLKEEAVLVASRAVVPTEFTEQGRWGRDLQDKGFNASVPTVWLLEGLLMYLTLDDTQNLMREVGRLSAAGSAIFHDACSANYVAHGRGPVVGGARFLGGSDEYSRLWHQHAGFGSSYVRNFEAVSVDRKARSVTIDSRFPEATEQVCRGKSLVLFVTAEKA